MTSQLNESAHKRHDLFNLIALPFLIFANLYFIWIWNQDTLIIFTFIFLFYIIVDCLWVVVIPNCVASPQTIIFHHIVTAAGLSLNLSLPFEFATITALGGLIEINTFLLIFRRNMKSNQFINYLFFFSWVLIRNIMVNLSNLLKTVINSF
jgi:hypothetical protein